VRDGAVGFAIVGLGRISAAHVQGLLAARQFARLVAVCDADPARAERVAKETGARVHASLDDVLADPDVEAVDLPLPHYLHDSAARQALAAGRHVLLEKPMAPTARECAELTAQAAAAGLAISVAENTRFVGAYLEAERLIQSGSLGEPRLVRTLIYGSSVVLRDRQSWKSRAATAIGGAIFDAAPHSIYLLKWLFGEIDHVRAFMNTLAPESEVEDHGVVAGRLRSGAIFTTEYMFTAEVPWGERLEVYGSEGTLVMDQLCNPPMRRFRGPADLAGEPVGQVAFDPAGWKRTSIAAGVAAFAAAVARGTPPPVDPKDGCYVMHVIEHAYQSVRAGGISVAVSAQ
jgi:predicted dehydrogenase